MISIICLRSSWRSATRHLSSMPVARQLGQSKHIRAKRSLPSLPCTTFPAANPLRRGRRCIVIRRSTLPFHYACQTRTAWMKPSPNGSLLNVASNITDFAGNHGCWEHLPDCRYRYYRWRLVWIWYLVYERHYRHKPIQMLFQPRSYACLPGWLHRAKGQRAGRDNGRYAWRIIPWGIGFRIPERHSWSTKSYHARSNRLVCGHPYDFYSYRPWLLQVCGLNSRLCRPKYWYAHCGPLHQRFLCRHLLCSGSSLHFRTRPSK